MKRNIATFYIGHKYPGGVWDHHSKVIPALKSAFTDGFTAWEATGGWYDGTEPTTVVQVVGMSGFEASAAKALLEFAFNQREVLCTIQEIELV